MRNKLLIFLLLFPCLLKAQNCFTGTDVQTGKVTKSGTTELTADSTLRSFKFSVSKADSSFSIGAALISPLAISNIDVNSLSLTITFTNGQTKTFNNSGGSQALNVPGGTAVIFQAPVTQDDLNYFHDNPVSGFSINLSGTILSTQVPQLNASQIISSLDCLNN